MDKQLSTVCDNCGKQFTNVYTLNAHKRQVHENKKPFKCNLCDNSFSTKYKLNRHSQGIHSEKRDNYCEVCGHAFKTREMLVKHNRIHFKGPFTCQICKEVFKYVASFNHHFKLKHEIKESNDQKAIARIKHHECKICLKVYKNVKSLQNHEITNHAKGAENAKIIKKSLKSENLVCYVCNKIFDKKADFESHITSHEQEEYRLDDMIVEETSTNQIVDDGYIEQSEIEYINEDSSNMIDYIAIKNESPEIAVESANFFYSSEKDENEVIVKREMDCIMPELANDSHQNVTFHPLDLIPSNIRKIRKNDNSKPSEKIVCDICGMLFMNKSHLKRHHARKHREKSDYKYECDICAAKFLLRYDLQRHMIKHNSNRDISCQKCNKQFKTKPSLDAHIKFIHNQDRSKLEKQFTCNICSRSYFHKRHLDYHMRKHTDDRRYACNQCEKSFLYSDAVKWHQIRIHKEPAPFMCNLCSRKFIHEKTFETHQKEHDEETGSLSVTCPFCNKKISEKRHLPRHIRTHLKKGFTCDFCHESFKERFQLTKHLLLCENKHNKEVEIIYETVVE